MTFVYVVQAVSPLSSNIISRTSMKGIPQRVTARRVRARIFNGSGYLREPHTMRLS